MRIGLAQLNTTVGDIKENRELIVSAYHECVEAGAELVITPELAITGYPPRDLLFKSRFVPMNLEVLDELAAQVGDVPLVVGFVDRNRQTAGNPFFNAAAVLHRGAIHSRHYKTLLPTYDVFDEDRYFQPAEENVVVELAGRKIGITICEDIWSPESLYRQLYHADPVRDLVKAGAEIILNLSASPFHTGKQSGRVHMLQAAALRHLVPVVYCNAVGGNDQLVFDGNSLVVAPDGVIAELPAFEECCRVVDLGDSTRISPVAANPADEVHRALVLGLRDYFRKCGFRSAVLGLSGGIDSAVTACIAVEALGAANVTGVTLPSRYSSPGSVDDSRILAENLGIEFIEVPIREMVSAFRDQLDPLFEGTAEDTTEENIQPRVRATVLMALSNKFGHLLLTTGNKSELAVGYCTLYGDMAGGLAVISDVPKTMVYDVARHINRNRELIPLATIEKPPSAELKPDQKDQDTLPEYEVLDAILASYVEQHMSVAAIVAQGFDEDVVRWVQHKVDLNEYKRAQAAPGLRVTSKAFGDGRRMPIAQRFVEAPESQTPL